MAVAQGGGSQVDEQQPDCRYALRKYVQFPRCWAQENKRSQG